MPKPDLASTIAFRVVIRLHLTAGALLLATSLATAQENGEQLYQKSCAACHGTDGKGPPAGRKLKVAVPDFTECSFSTREPDPDWLAVVHQGGPVRAFDETMPAYGESLTEAEIMRTIDYIRTLCDDDRWPRGELNLPRSFFIEKAYPEDEAVNTLSVSTEGRGIVLNEIVYEKRFGPRSQIELKIPFGATEDIAGGWNAGLGDLVLGAKHVLHHSLRRGTILSVGAEAKLPTGSTSAGLGGDTWVGESFLSLGKAFPSDAFAQFIAKVEVPFDKGAEREAAFGAVIGKTFIEGRWGRTWTPMAELLAARELENGTSIEWDVVPQLQVSLNQRQHVLGNIGVRLPLSDTTRSTRLIVYILWDWFDGGFFDGW